MSDIEEEYLRGIEREEEIFIEGRKNNKNLSELEKRYSKQVKEIRKAYEKSLKKELRSKKNIKTSKKEEKKEEKIKEFKAEGIELEKNKVEDIKIKLSSKSYRVFRRIKNFIYKITPKKIIYFYHRIRLRIKNIKKHMKNVIKRIFEKTSNRFSIIWTHIKEGFMRVMSIIKKLFSFFKKKKKEKPKEKEDKNGEKA